MKRLMIPFAIAAITLVTCVPVKAQSRSFQAFRDRFNGEENVQYFKVSGFVVRSVLGMAGEHEAKEAVRNIHKVRLAVVPREAFAQQEVTVAGFRKVMRQDAFDELMEFRENGDQVTVYSNASKDRDDRCYLMLVEDDDEIVLIEITGTVNEQYFKNLVKLQSQKT